MNEISQNMREIISSSDKINSDSIVAQEHVAEFSKLIENSKKIIDENDSIFEKIELTSNEFKESVS